MSHFGHHMVSSAVCCGLVELVCADYNRKCLFSFIWVELKAQVGATLKLNDVIITMNYWVYDFTDFLQTQSSVFWEEAPCPVPHKHSWRHSWRQAGEDGVGFSS